MSNSDYMECDSDDTNNPRQGGSSKRTPERSNRLNKQSPDFRCLPLQICCFIRLPAPQGCATSHGSGLYLGLFLQTNKYRWYTVQKWGTWDNFRAGRGMSPEPKSRLVESHAYQGRRYLKNAFRSISRKPSTHQQKMCKPFLYIIRFPIFFVFKFLFNINIFKLLTFTKLSLQYLLNLYYFPKILMINVVEH